jgi:hypothetical protein
MKMAANRFYGLLLIGAGLGLATAAHGADKKGVVTDVTAKRVYFNQGSEDGVVVGMKVMLSRRGKGAMCQVDAVGPTTSTCITQSMATPGQRVVLPGSARAAKKKVAKKRTPWKRLKAERLEKRRARLLAASFSKVAFKGDGKRRLALAPSGAQARFEHRSMGTFSGDQGTFHRESIFLSGFANDVLLDGLQASVRAEGRGLPNQPNPRRFRPDDPLQLYVDEVRLGYAPTQGGFGVEAGRIHPRDVVGVPLLDGASGGLRFLDDGLRVGAFGGLVPDPVREIPRSNHWTAGSFLAGSHRMNRQVALHHQSRISLSGSGQGDLWPDFQTRVFGDWGRALQASGGVRMSVMRDAGGAPFSLDGADVNAASTLLPGWRVDTGYRYQGAPVWDANFLLGEAFARSHRGNLGLVVDALPWVVMGLGTGGSWVATDVLWHAFGNAHVGVKPPGSQRPVVGLDFQEDFGAFSGRMLGAFGNVDVLPWIRWHHRATYYGTFSEGAAINSVGYTTRFEVPFQSWWGLSGGLHTRLGLDNLRDREDGAAPLSGGLSANLELFGRY